MFIMPIDADQYYAILVRAILTWESVYYKPWSVIEGAHGHQSISDVHARQQRDGPLVTIEEYGDRSKETYKYKDKNY